MPTYSDYFSQSAALYALHRPSYPAALFEWLARGVRGHQRAWDCATGNGQAAVALASHFGEVVATDPSQSQLVYAVKLGRVHYAAMTAEDSALRSASVDLITVAQALHWFNLPRFYDEVARVLVPGGVLAVWTYGLLSITPEIDALMLSFYKDTLRGYWPAERALVDAGYSGIAFPFLERSAPQFEMERNWTLEQLSGYLETWSAVTRYQKANGESPVGRFVTALRALWGHDDTARRVTWPLELRVGSI
jgi:ubiquinone/menaquinone biosynthesis C-methylase UbiE